MAQLAQILDMRQREREGVELCMKICSQTHTPHTHTHTHKSIYSMRFYPLTSSMPNSGCRTMYQDILSHTNCTHTHTHTRANIHTKGFVLCLCQTFIDAWQIQRYSNLAQRKVANRKNQYNK